VTGIDLAVPMLAHARDRAQRAGLGNVTFRKGDAEDPGTDPGWEPGSFDVILAGNVIQFLARPEYAAQCWRSLLTPYGTLGIAWSLAQDPQWGPVLAAIDAHVPDGVPGFAAFMRRPPFGSIPALEQVLTGYGCTQVATATRTFTMTYQGPQQWWQVYQTQGPWALSWRHIPPAGLDQARHDAFTLLEAMRGSDGTLTRTLTFACTMARRGSW
jgi:SAM-dependent methyltransferase